MRQLKEALKARSHLSLGQRPRKTNIDSYAGCRSASMLHPFVCRELSQAYSLSDCGVTNPRALP